MKKHKPCMTSSNVNWNKVIELVHHSQKHGVCRPHVVLNNIQSGVQNKLMQVGRLIFLGGRAKFILRDRGAILPNNDKARCARHRVWFHCFIPCTMNNNSSRCPATGLVERLKMKHEGQVLNYRDCTSTIIINMIDISISKVEVGMKIE
jgi:hypothetical protein